MIREQERLVSKGGGGVSDLSFCGQQLTLLPPSSSGAGAILLDSSESDSEFVFFLLDLVLFFF